jgi:phage tail-like protein
VSCGPETVRFRLLDGHVGWSPSPATIAHSNLDGLTAEGGVLELALLSPGAVAPGDIDPYLPPPYLARGCGPCEWFLAQDEALLHLGCSKCFEPVCEAPHPGGASSVAARGHWIAISDPNAHRVWLLARSGEQVVAEIGIAAPGPVAFSRNELLVAVDGESRLRRYDLAGARLVDFGAVLPANSKVVRLGVGEGGVVFAVTQAADASLHLWRARRASHFHAATIAELAHAFRPTGVVAAANGSFSILQRSTSGLDEARAFDRKGDCIEGPITPPPPPPRQPRGQLLTVALDSGIPRCRWHRVRIDADVPAGTRLLVAVATSEEAAPAAQGAVDPGWAGFDPGLVHPNDWQKPDGAPLDFVIQQPPGRWLFVRVRLIGDGFATPRVHRIRLDLPRSTSLERLPAVYRETPAAEDFSERFLSLFDATIEEIDRSIARAPALLDAGGLPEGALPWLGAFLDIAFDPQWTAAQRRALIAAAPEIYAVRGTKAGFARTIQIVTGVAPAIVEMALERRFGALRPVGKAPAGEYARLGAVRLFGRSQARFRVGSSAVGGAPLRSFGNPDQDPLWEDAFRFAVLVPPQALGSLPNGRERLEKLIASQKPAHTLASLRVGGGGFVLGVSSSVGVGTVLGGWPEVVLGVARLSRQSIVAPDRKGRRVGFRVGTAAVGLQTVIS